MKDDVQHILREIVQSDAFCADGIANKYRLVVDELNHLTIPQGRWTWNYLHEVAHGKLKPSRLLTAAILRLQNRLHIRRGQTLELECTQVLAPAGFIVPGTIINASSRKCAFSLCGRNFIPINPAQKFCSPECRKTFHQIKKEAAYVDRTRIRSAMQKT
jgi:hypothetical protein